MAIDPSTPGIALAATSNGVYRSTDACRTWSSPVSGLEPATAATVLFHPAHAGEAFVAQAGRVFRSSDGGRNWQPLDSTGSSQDSAFWPSSFLIPASAPDRLFALVPGRGVFSIIAPNTGAAMQRGSSN
jgi:photosystem II stability/assembly factor-like uncharacterized protein